ncbi:MAG: SDR family NAD(P)-dependent oxidoreductase [Ilumatobacteraceae bacterium]
MPRNDRDPPGTAAGDVVVITGASRGIGAELCRRFSATGAKVGMIARDATMLGEVQQALSSGSHAAVADVADRVAVAAAFADIERVLGPVSVVVNNAGFGSWDAVVETDADVFGRAIDVNYLGTVYPTLCALPGMLTRGRGHIINISSIAGRIGAPFEAAYSASKFAVVGFSEALAVEIDGTGVEVSMIHPGPVATEFAAARKRPAPRRTPRPVPVGAVADAVMATVRRPRRNRYVPAWLGLAVAAKAVVPVAHRLGTARLFAAERRKLRHG